MRYWAARRDEIGRAIDVAVYRDDWPADRLCLECGDAGGCLCRCRAYPTPRAPLTRRSTK